MVLQSGFSPATFALLPGKYDVAPSDFGGYFFNRWNDSVKSRVHTVTIIATGNVSLTALYFTSPTTAPDFAMASSPVIMRVAGGASGTLAIILASVNGFDSAVSLSAESPSITGVAATFKPSSLTPSTVGTVGSTMSVTVAPNASLGTYPLTITAVSGNLSNSITLPLTVSRPAPADGITVYAYRVQSPYWAPCFATTCALGTGPGASMYFVLYNSVGGIVQTGFANENGFTFTGLNTSATYYLVWPSDCDTCHNSPHNAVFAYWGDGSSTRPLMVTLGSSLDAWFEYVPT
jgi:hypothetical protein